MWIQRRRWKRASVLSREETEQGQPEVGTNPGESGVPEAKEESIPVEGLKLPFSEAAESRMREQIIVDCLQPCGSHG